MMNIDEMTDQEKSVLLARAVGWEFSRHECGEPRWSWVDENGQQISGSIHDRVVQVSDDRSSLVSPMLYSPQRMALAWRVLNWAVSDPGFGWEVDGWLWNDGLGYDLPNLEPADAQRQWLDKVLELAIEAGLIPD
jgi:hypothetical protein